MKRMLMVVLAVIFAGNLLWAAGGTQAGPGAERVYTIMFPLIFPEVPPADAPVVQVLRRISPHPFEFRYVPTDGYQDMLNISIAAGDLPDSFVVTSPTHNSFVSAATGGLFWEVSDAIRSSRYISANMPQMVLLNTNIGGNNFHVPRTRGMVDTGFNFRKDWLENLGLEPPTTMDEVYNIIRAIGTQDPDGTGRRPFGLITGADSSGIWQLRIPAAIFGAGNGWVEDNDRLIPIFMTEQYMDTVRFYKRLYDERLMNQDFATISAERALEALGAEAGGTFFDTISRPMSRFEVLVRTKQAQNPNIQLEDLWDYTSEIRGVDGSVRLPAHIGYFGGFAFPRTSLRTQAEFQAAFDIIDSFDSDEAKNVLRWGVEGRNFQFQADGRAVGINVDNHAREVNLFGQLYVTGANIPGSIVGVRRPYQERVDATYTVIIDYGITDPTFPLISPTQTSRGAELQMIIADAQIQWVMGAINEAGFRAAVELWRTSGGQQVMDEFTQAWRASRR